MDERDLKKTESLLSSLKREFNQIDTLVSSLHQSARRAGSSLGYSRVLQKSRVLLKVLDDLQKDFSLAKSEHVSLLEQGYDSPAVQNYNYSRIDLKNLPIKKNR